MEGLSGHNCSQVAAAKDHTVVLTEDGCVYTFGLNIFHQLGIVPPPSSCNVPRQVNFAFLNNEVTVFYKTCMDKEIESINSNLFYLYSVVCIYSLVYALFFTGEIKHSTNEHLFGVRKKAFGK